MLLKTISENAAASAVAAQASVTFTKTPHLPARDMAFLLVMGANTGAPTIKIQGSDSDPSVADGAAVWVDVATVAVAIGNATHLVQGQSYKRMRSNVTVAGAAGDKFSLLAIAD